MKSTRIAISGFCNIKDFSINLTNFNALIAPNNYGKSNVLAAIDFGMRFISATNGDKVSMMSDTAFIPINNNTSKLPFHFYIEGILNVNNQDISIRYGYDFEWRKTNGEGAVVTGEMLSIMKPDAKRPTILAKRDGKTKAFYTPSQTSRCTKQMEIDAHQLVISALLSKASLFYKDIIYAVANMHLNMVQSSGFNKDELCKFIYDLKINEPHRYSLLEDFILQIVGNITSFLPVRTVLGNPDSSIPYRIEDAIYDIRIREKHNNQDISISRLSSGSRRIITIITEIIKAEMTDSSLICIEELENSVHPKLLENLILLVQSFAEGICILTTSHSPYLVRYLNSSQLSFGLPTNNGVASFHKVKKSKIKKILKSASALEMTLGEYMFELMLELDDDPNHIIELFEE